MAPVDGKAQSLGQILNASEKAPENVSEKISEEDFKSGSPDGGGGSPVVGMVTHRLNMIDLEVVVRNWMAGSTAKRLGIPEGQVLEKPLVEFYYKKDELGDPFISDDQALLLKTLEREGDLQILKQKALEVNTRLQSFFGEVGICLVDFKLEYGYTPEGNILLGDEISPDSCRLWDQQSHEKMDKDRFRRDLGQVLEKYQEVLDRITGAYGSQGH